MLHTIWSWQDFWQNEPIDLIPLVTGTRLVAACRLKPAARTVVAGLTHGPCLRRRVAEEPPGSVERSARRGCACAFPVTATGARTWHNTRGRSEGLGGSSVSASAPAIRGRVFLQGRRTMMTTTD